MKNLASVLLASAAFVVATSLLPVTADAQTAVTCSSIDITTFPGLAAKSCTGQGTPAFAGLFNSTIQSLGTSATDSASRLSTQIPSNDIGATVSITITDSDFSPSGSTTLSYQIAQGDSLSNIEQALINQINALSDFYAYQSSAAAITIFSFSGNSTTYSATVGGAMYTPSETITTSTDGSGNEVVTMNALAGTNTWFLYANHADYYVQRMVSPPPIDGPPWYASSMSAGAFGITEETPFNPTSAVFENTSPDSSASDNLIAHVTAHETGHQLDAIYGLLKTGSEMEESTAYSLSADFTAAFNLDIAKVNLIPPCAFDASDRYSNDSGGFTPEEIIARPGKHGSYDSSGGSVPDPDGAGRMGLFSGLQDSSGNYICSGTDGYGRDLAGEYAGESLTGSANQNIINYAFPNLTSISTETRDARREIFAEEYATLAGFPDTQDNSASTIPGSDTILGRAYACTYLYVQSLSNKGQLPTSSDLSFAGYVSPNTFTGDANGIIYGPPTPVNPDAITPGMYSDTLNACDGSTTPVDLLSFGN